MAADILYMVSIRGWRLIEWVFQPSNMSSLFFVNCRLTSELFEASERRNKWQTNGEGLPAKWHSKQMVACICKEEVHEYHDAPLNSFSPY